MPGIHSDITTAFGETPLVRLNALTEGLGAEVLAKLEFYNPGSSVKDRLGYALVDAAEAAGELLPGGTIVESTSGNTGISLALIGAARGYRVILTMPATSSLRSRVAKVATKLRCSPVTFCACTCVTPNPGVGRPR